MRNLREFPVTTGEALDFVTERYGEWLKNTLNSPEESAYGDMTGEYWCYLVRRLVPPDGYYSAKNKWFVTGHGQVIVSLHPPERCAGQACCVHSPSEHTMRGFRTYYRSDRRLMERICPHGVGHPDPDDLAHKERVSPSTSKYEGVHGCDGCCS